MAEEYAGRQVVGMDLHWQRSVLGRMSEDGRKRWRMGSALRASSPRPPVMARSRVKNSRCRVPTVTASMTVSPSGVPYPDRSR